MEAINKKMFRIFEAHGVELEYMIVDRETLDILPITDQLLRHLAGDWTMEVERGPISLNNELALHVLELKTSQPTSTVEELPELFQNEVLAINRELVPFGAMLMPSAMHPWMDPFTAFKVWPHGDAAVYKKYHEIFDCRGHGWANLQSTHLNLPFGDEVEFCKLHSAMRVVLPLIPALAASSPFSDGKSTGMKDFRIRTYRNNQAKIFSVTGHVIPEVVNSFADYHQNILEVIYRDISPYDSEGILRYEWCNSRGAIARFDRNAIEIRLIDIQECPLADCCIAWVITQVLKLLCKETWGTIEDYNALSCERLRAILDKTQVDAEEALIDDEGYLRTLGWNQTNPPKAQDLWRHLAESFASVPPIFAEVLERYYSHGTLASRLQKRAGPNPTHETLAKIYRELCGCLSTGRIFLP